MFVFAHDKFLLTTPYYSVV